AQRRGGISQVLNEQAIQFPQFCSDGAEYIQLAGLWCLLTEYLFQPAAEPADGRGTGADALGVQSLPMRCASVTKHGQARSQTGEALGLKQRPDQPAGHAQVL